MTIFLFTDRIKPEVFPDPAFRDPSMLSMAIITPIHGELIVRSTDIDGVERININRVWAEPGEESLKEYKIQNG